jgi:hypothetical protein
MECCLEDRLFDLFFELGLDIFHEDETCESFLFVSDLTVDLPSDEPDHHPSDHEIEEYHDDHSSEETHSYCYPVSMELIETEIFIGVLELWYRGIHRMY